MAIISRPVGYGALLMLAGGLLWWSNLEPVKATTRSAAKKQSRSKSNEQNWDFPASEVALRFDKPTDPMRNIFKPLISVDRGSPEGNPEQLMKVPANLAGGEGDWAYTGMVEVDGVRMALLENATKHQGGYVKEGEAWKRSRVTRITMASILMLGEDGSEETVFRFNANQTPKVKPPADGGFHPMDLGPALKGVIGQNVQIQSIDSPAMGK